MQANMEYLYKALKEKVMKDILEAIKIIQTLFLKKNLVRVRIPLSRGKR